MKKKLYTIALAGISTMCLSFTAFAAEANNNQKLNYKATDEMVTAVIIDEEGNKIPLDVDVKLTELPAKLSRSGEVEKRYAISAYTDTAKSESNNKDINNTAKGIHASGLLYMEWTDVSGPDNTIDYIEGTWNVLEGQYNSGKLRYGGDHNRPHVNTSVDSTFSTSASYTGKKLHACFLGKLEGVNSKGNATYLDAYVCVQPNIFD